MRNTKISFNSNKIEQSTQDILSLSGITNIIGDINVFTGGTFNLYHENGEMLSKNDLFNTNNSISANTGTIVQHSQLIQNKIDKDDTINNGELLQKKAGGSFEGSGKSIDQILVKIGATISGSVIDFTGGTTALDTLSSTKTYTGINNLDHGVGWLIITHNNYDVYFNQALGVTVGTFINYGGKYIIEIINFGTLASPEYFFADKFGGVTNTIPDEDITPPTLTAEAVTGITASGFILPITSNEDAMIYAMVKANGSAAPTNIVEIINNVGGLQAVSVDGSGGVLESLAFSGRQSGTIYNIYYCGVDKSPNLNETGVFGPIQVETVAVDSTAPVLTVGSPQIGSTTVTIPITSNEGGTIALWVGTNGQSPTNIDALLSGTSALEHTTRVTNGGVAENMTINNLDPLTDYDFWYGGVDVAGNKTSTTKIDIITISTTAPDQHIEVGLSATGSPPMQYMAYLPENYDPLIYYRLVVELHGFGEAAGTPVLLSQLYKVKAHGLTKALADDSYNPNVIVISPQSRNGYWMDADNQTILANFYTYLLDDARFPYRWNKTAGILLTGLSFGASGVVEAMDNAFIRANTAAIAPFSGGQDASLVAIDQADDVAFWIIHGTADTNPPTAYSKSYIMFHKALQQSNPIETPKMTLLDGGSFGHNDNVWTNTWTNANNNAPVLNVTYQGVPLNSTQFTTLNPFRDWFLSRVKGQAIDTTPPTLVTLAESNITNSSVTIDFEVNEESTGWLAVFTGSTLKSKAEIRGDVAGAVQFTGPVTLNPSTVWNINSLLEDTGYSVQGYARDTLSNESAVFSTGLFTTLASDTTAPAITSASLSNAGLTTLDGSVTINEPNRIYVALTLSASPTLTPAQIKAGSDGSIVQAITRTGVAAGIAETFNFTGLTNGTSYKMQVAAEDSVNNLSTTTTESASLSTTSPVSSTEFLVALGNSDAALVTQTGWNNARANPGSGGFTLSNLIAADGSSTSVGFAKVSLYAAGSTTGGVDAVGGDAEAAIPANASKSFWYNGDDSGFNVGFTGLEASTTYQVRTLSSRGGVTGTRNTRMTVVGQTPVTTNAVLNTDWSEWVTFTTTAGGATPNINHVRNTSGDQFTYLNAIHLKKV